MKNIRSSSTEELEKVMGAMDQQEFLRRNMPNYAPSMRENSRLNLMAEPQSFVNPSQRNELMEMTQLSPMGRANQMLGGSDTKGIMGRLGGSYNLDRDTTLSGGISGFAGRDRGEFTVKPSTADLGIARRMGPGTLAAQYQRSLTGQQPPRYMANYSIPYAEGGQVRSLPDLGPSFSFENFKENFKPFGLSLSEENAAIAFNQLNGISPFANNTMGNIKTMEPIGTALGILSSAFPGAARTTQLPAMQARTGQYRTAQEEAQLDYPQVVDNSSTNPNTNSSSFAGPKTYYGNGFGGGFGAGSGNGGPFPLEGKYGIIKMAAGGHLGGYSDGGRMLKGPGDGMSDDIPGIIGGKQPARLADGEFVVPADVVSHLGNGSTDAGAKRLYAMMDEVRKARTGNKKQGKQIKAQKYLPA